MARPTYYDQIWLSARHNADLTSSVELSNDVFETKVSVDVYVQSSDMRLSCAFLSGQNMTLDVNGDKAPITAHVSSNISVTTSIQEEYRDGYLDITPNPDYGPDNLLAFTLSAMKNTPAHNFKLSVWNERYCPENASMSVLTLNILPNDLRLIGSSKSGDYVKLIANMSCDFLRSAEQPQLYFAERNLSAYEESGILQFAKIINGSSVRSELSVNSPCFIKNYAELAANSKYLKFYTDNTFNTELADPYNSNGNMFFYELDAGSPTTDLSIVFQVIDKPELSARYDLRIMNTQQIEPEFKLAPNVEFDGKEFTIWLEPNLTGDMYNCISVYSDIQYDVSFAAEKTKEIEA